MCNALTRNFWFKVACLFRVTAKSNGMLIKFVILFKIPYTLALMLK